MAVFPSDQFVDGDALFMKFVEAACRTVSAFPEKIALLGNSPERPDVELGYITIGQPLPHTEGVFRVSSFVEKPDCETARSLMGKGALWNSFVMVFRVGRMLELLEAVLPVEFDNVRRLAVGNAALTAGYAALAPWNFSTRFLARIPDELVAVRVKGVHWSDWGTRASVERTFERLQYHPPWLLRRQSPGAALGRMSNWRTAS